MSVTPGHNYAEQSTDFGVSGQLDWDVGGINVTSITAYRDWDSERDQDIDFSRMDRSYRDGLEIGVQSFTQEIRLQGEWGRLNWLVGGFYGDESIEQTDRIQYGTQADDYVDSLLGFFDFSLLGAPNTNGPLPGSGADVYTCTPGAPGASTCALDYAMFGLSLFGGAGEAAVTGTQAQLAGAIGVFSTAMMAAGLPAGSGQQNDRWGIDTQSMAIFTHNEISITDDLILTLGARWTQEEKEMAANIDATQASCAAIRANRDAVYAALVVKAAGVFPANAAISALANALPDGLLLTCNPAVNDVQDGTYARSLEQDAISGVASLAWHATDDLMIYGGYSRGYKSGGFNIDRSGMSIRPWTVANPATLSPYALAAIAYLNTVPNQGQPTTFGAAELEFQEETIDAYEIGFKSTFGDGVATLNMAAFYQELHDYQLNAFNGFNFITRNVPEVVSQGVEAEFAARPTDRLTVTLGALYSDVYYDSTVAFGSKPSDTVTAGSPLTVTPEWTFTGSIGYEIPLAGNTHLLLYGNGRHLSDYRLQTLSRNPLTDQTSFTIFDARVSLGADSGRWSIDAWVRNFMDEYYSVGAFAVPEQSTFNTPTQRVEGVFAAYPNEPRTVGLTVRARY